MNTKSQLEQIEDYNFGVLQLVKKGKSETDTKSLLEKRGLNYSEISEIIENIYENYKGVKFIESRLYKRLIGLLIDAIPLLILFFIFNNIIPDKYLKGTLNEWLFIFSVYGIYYIPLESIWGVTLGKFVMGNRLVDINYKTPKTYKVILRTLIRIIPNTGFYHDKLSKTYVVDNRRLKEILNQ